MTKIYYEKVGRKYVPVSLFDSDFMNSFRNGAHLVIADTSSRSRIFPIDPAYAPLIAASRIAENVMSTAIRLASELRPARAELTPGQVKAWHKLSKELGDELATLSAPSSRDIARAGVTALQVEAMKLMENVTVKAAYDEFLMIVALTKESTLNT